MIWPPPKPVAETQPSVLYVATGRQINDLANGSVCLALTYNGDVSMAADQAHKASKPYEVAYRIPREGTLIWQDNLAIPKDAPNPQAARAFINSCAPNRSPS
jgi:putrescine transport system substrate-binding protein